MIRLNDIYNFIEVSSFKSFSFASKKMEVTQPSLSESIGRLEKDLKFKLFYRSKNGISLTPQGRKVLEKSKILNDLIQSLNSEEIENVSSVILGCHSTIASYFLPNFFSKIKKKYLNIKFNYDTIYPVIFN